MSLESPLEFDDVPDALARGEFSRVDSLINQLRKHEPISEVDSGWFVYGGLARYYCEDFVGALADYRTALFNSPDNISALTNLAYLLACCPDGTLHDANSAVQLATRACEITEWKVWTHLQVLAAAYARQGKFKQAEEYATTAMSLAPEYAIWRCERLVGSFKNRQPFTGNVKEDFERMRCDYPVSE